MKSSDKDAGWYPTEMGENVMLVVHFIPETIPRNYEFWREILLTSVTGGFSVGKEDSKTHAVIGLCSSRTHFVCRLQSD